MDKHCITCRFCNCSEGYTCTLGRLSIDDPYSDSCGSWTLIPEQPYIIGVNLAQKPEDYRPCPRGYGHCVNDPAYLKVYHPEYYQDLYGDLTPEQASAKSCQERIKEDPGEEFYCYDDGDK